MLYKSGPILVLFENYCRCVRFARSTVHKLLRMRRVNAYLVSVRVVPPRLVTVLYCILSLAM